MTSTVKLVVTIVLVTNAVLAAILVAGFVLGKVPWEQTLVGLGVLLAPGASMVPLLLQRNGTTSDRPPPPGLPAIVAFCGISSMLAALGVAASGCAASTIADKAYELENDRCRETHAPKSRGLYDCYAHADAKWKVTQTVADGGAR